MNNKFSIVIAIKGYSKNLSKTLESINKQIYLPNEVIIVSNDRILQTFNLNKKITLKKYTSKIKNQVFQRNIAIKNISKKSNLILQLDERVFLNKNCLYYLNNLWKNSDQSVIGVGINQINRFESRGLLNMVIQNFNLKGKVLTNGMNIDYSNVKKDIEVMWLKGGLSSWRIKKNKKIKDYKYPLWKWSIFEDVEFCLKKNSKDKLLVSHKAKAKIIDRNKKLSTDDLIYRGSIHTFSQKRLVKKYFKNMTFFFLNYPFFNFFKSNYVNFDIKFF